jgi:hypothetical protein
VRRLLGHRLVGDQGTAAVEMPLAVGLLLLPIAMVVMVVPQWPERQTLATAAAKEAASLYANAADPATGAAQARAAVGQAAANHGVPESSMTVSLGGEWCRACTVSASVTVAIPAIDVPFAGAVGGFEWTATSEARIDDYRNMSGGLDGPSEGQGSG